MPTYIAVALIVDPEARNVLLLEEEDRYRLPGIAVQGATPGFEACVQRLKYQGFHLLPAHRFDPEMLQIKLREFSDSVCRIGEELPTNANGEDEEFHVFMCTLDPVLGRLKECAKWFPMDRIQELLFGKRIHNLIADCLREIEIQHLVPVSS